jgi:hypothetical protein
VKDISIDKTPYAGEWTDEDHEAYAEFSPMGKGQYDRMVPRKDIRPSRWYAYLEENHEKIIWLNW